VIRLARLEKAGLSGGQGVGPHGTMSPYNYGTGSVFFGVWPDRYSGIRTVS
jgi:hypothetical protein